MSRRHGSAPEQEPDWLVLQLPGDAAEPASVPLTDGAIRGIELRTDGARFERVGRRILDDVSVAARPGRLLAVTGPSGSGKSSLIALLAGIERPDGGTVRAGGAPLAGLLPDAGLILQAYGLVSVLTAAENVEVTLQVGPRLGKLDVQARARGALDAVGLLDVGDHLVEELSGGQQQRVAVARALVRSPRVLLADEPTAELDHASKERVFALLLAHARRGATVVVATHDQEIADQCDDQLRLVDGRVA